MSGLDPSISSQRCRKRRRRRTAVAAAVLAVAAIAVVAVASAARSSSHVAPSSSASGASSSKSLSTDSSVSAWSAAVVERRTKRARGYVRVFPFRVLQLLLSLSRRHGLLKPILPFFSPNFSLAAPTNHLENSSLLSPMRLDGSMPWSARSEATLALGRGCVFLDFFQFSFSWIP